MLDLKPLPDTGTASVHKFLPFASTLALLAAGIGASGIAVALPCVWTGATSGNWSESTNWSCAGGPAAGDDLEFPEVALNKAMVQDISNLSVNALTFSGAGGGYTLTGTGNLTIAGAAAITSKATGVSQNTLALTNPLKFGAAVAVVDTSTGADGAFNLNGPIDLNGSVLSGVWDSTVPYTFVNGVISGSGGLSVDGVGGDVGLRLAGNNTFTGPVVVNSGYLQVNHPNALGAGGSAADGTRVFGSGTLVLGADIANEHLTLEQGSGTSGNGMMQANANRIWGGPVVLNGSSPQASNFNIFGRQVTFSGPVSGTGGLQCCNGVDGKIALSNAGNTYSGPSSFTLGAGGMLRLLANDALSPNSALTLGGSTGGILDMGAFSGTAASFAGSTGSALNITTGQKLTINGAVALNGTALNLTVNGSPVPGTVFTILEKNSAGALAGTFNGLAEGATLTVGAVDMIISYVGGSGNDVTLTVQGPVAVTAAKAGSGSGTVQGNSGLISCGPTCSDMYMTGTSLTLTATPTAGHQFTGWLGPCTGTGDCVFTVTAPTTVTATFAAVPVGAQVLDIDGEGNYDALTDGLLALRYLFGLSGPGLIDNAVTPGAPRNTDTAIADYLLDIKPFLDIDGNGQADALTDGLLILRYLFNLTGDSLIANAIGPGATRDNAPAIAAQIESLKP